jgi:hypothetical protein
VLRWGRLCSLTKICEQNLCGWYRYSKERFLNNSRRAAPSILFTILRGIEKIPDHIIKSKYGTFTLATVELSQPAIIFFTDKRDLMRTAAKKHTHGNRYNQRRMLGEKSAYVGKSKSRKPLKKKRQIKLKSAGLQPSKRRS